MSDASALRVVLRSLPRVFLWLGADAFNVWLRLSKWTYVAFSISVDADRRSQ